MLLGFSDADELGDSVEENVGVLDGDELLGPSVGVLDGEELLGASVGVKVGLLEGLSVGEMVGFWL